MTHATGDDLLEELDAYLSASRRYHLTLFQKVTRLARHQRRNKEEQDLANQELQTLLDQLKNQVQDERTGVVAAVEKLIAGIPQRINAAVEAALAKGVSEEQLAEVRQISGFFTDNEAALAQAVVQGTPADPNAPVPVSDPPATGPVSDGGTPAPATTLPVDDQTGTDGAPVGETDTAEGAPADATPDTTAAGTGTAPTDNTGVPVP